MDASLIIPNSKETVVINIAELLFVEAEGNYSTFWLTNKRPMLVEKEKPENVDGRPHNPYDITVAMQLGAIGKIIEKSSNQVRKSLVRIGRSYVINLNYLFKIDLSNSMLYLMDSDHNIYKLADAGRDNLVELKKAIER